MLDYACRVFEENYMKEEDLKAVIRATCADLNLQVSDIEKVMTDLDYEYSMSPRCSVRALVQAMHGIQTSLEDRIAILEDVE